MAFDYSLLMGRIIEKYGTQYNFAREMGISERSISLKLNNKVPWKDAEIYKASNLLEIVPEEISRYFFAEKVQV